MIAINNLPECKECEHGYLLPFSSVIYEYYNGTQQFYLEER